MTSDHPRLLAVSLTALMLVGGSCSTSTTTSTEPDQPTLDASTGTSRSDAPASTAEAAEAGVLATTPAPQGQDTLEQQRRRALVRKFLEDANRLRQDGKLEAALLEASKAKELQPGNKDVLSLIATITAELGRPAGTAITFADEMIARQQIVEQRRRTQVMQRMQDGRQAMADTNFEGALQELRQAILIMELADTQDWSGMLDEAKALQSDAERRLDEQIKEQQEDLAREAEAMARTRYREEQAMVRAKVDALTVQAQQAFRERRFELCQEYTARALKLEPNNAGAFDLQNASIKASRDKFSENYYYEKAREIRAMQEAAEDLKIPQTDILRMDFETWEKALRRSRNLTPEATITPTDQAVWSKVRSEQTGKLTLTEDSGEYAQVTKNLSLITGVPIIITPAARDIIDSESLVMVIELVNSISLENFLDQMASRSETLAWTVRNGVVQITSTEEAGGTNTVETYDVRDLVFPRTAFLPPRIREIPTEEDISDVPRTGGESEDKVAFVELDQLMQNIQEATDPTYWESEGAEINPEDQGYLVVKASPEMHQRVWGVLNDMRRFATSVVTIDSKFLTVTKNFLQEVGVDFRGLGGSGAKGTVTVLDDITNGLDDNASRGLDNGGTADPAASPVSGAFFNDGGDGDVRARTENFFLNDLAKSLTPNGGLTASVALLDDLQVQAILRAVEKQQEAEVVNSQILTVLNNERGHVAIINQTAYVKDFDVEVAQASFVADPKVDIIQDGVVLDVQPVIHHDRRYITLSLEPTVAELERPIPTFTTSLAGSTLPVTMQLPNLTVTNFATTVKVPDGGSVLLGGLRQVLTRERKAEIPLLASLPLISFLFKTEGVADENRSLMVMVQAWITDIRDLVATRGR